MFHHSNEFMKKQSKKAKKANLITINGYHDAHGIDRRTVKKYLAEDGLEPVTRRRGRAYYDEDEITRIVLERHPHASTPNVETGPKDALEKLRDVYDRLLWANLGCVVPSWYPEDYVNIPANYAAILAHSRDVMSPAITKLGDLIGRDSEGCVPPPKR